VVARTLFSSLTAMIKKSLFHLEPMRAHNMGGFDTYLLEVPFLVPDL